MMKPSIKSDDAPPRHADDANRPPPQRADLKRRLRVWWATDKRYYLGTFTAISADRAVNAASEDDGSYRVHYDDGQVLWERLGGRRGLPYAFIDLGVVLLILRKLFG